VAIHGTLRLAGLAALACAAGCVRERPPPPPGVLTVSVEQESAWVRNFNPLTSAAVPRWPTWAGIYEPLYVWSGVRGEHVPWLATGHTWSDGGRRLRVELRRGVRWSDGRPFGARDVAFTFELLRRFPALDRRGQWTHLTAVRATDDGSVDFTFDRPYLPGLEDVVAQLIVPEHAWRDVADPVGYANEHPVATGPFTEVRVFERQIYELGRNPDYWQPGLPRIDALRFPAYPSNERANLALVFDEVDWAGNFVPAIDRVFVARAPADHAYWFPLTAPTVFLYANTRRPPFDDPRVRKALSMAIDRELLVEVALFRYARAADASALSDAYPGWRDPVAAAASWTHHDLAAAAALLDAAGHRLGEDGRRRLPDGSPWRYEVMVVSGWSDWVRAAQVIARGLRELGIDATVRTYDYGAWSQRVQEGRFDLTLGWTLEGPTPYTLFRWLMSTETVKPEGTSSFSNWHRYGSPEADRLLRAFEREPELAARHALAAELQRTFAAEAPAIPLYFAPSWAAYNTRRFTGFPSAANPTADPSPNKFEYGETLLVLTTLAPRGGP